MLHLPEDLSVILRQEGQGGEKNKGMGGQKKRGMKGERERGIRKKCNNNSGIQYA